LEARIAEDEMYARGAIRESGAEWDRCYEYDELTCIVAIDNDSASVTKNADGLACALDKSTAKFIARFDPARILAECAAKRALLELYVESEGADRFRYGDPYQMDGEANAYYAVLEVLAAPYSDHEDYNEEWKSNAEES
jgi:hypothetical protein